MNTNTSHSTRLWISFLLSFVLGCAGRLDPAAVYTEGGIEAAGQEWVRDYNAKADECERLHAPESPEMEECFGAWYDAHVKALEAVKYTRAVLIGYWTARAAGEKPDLLAVLRDIQAAFDALPPEAKAYFDRVKGIKP